MLMYVFRDKKKLKMIPVGHYHHDDTHFISVISFDGNKLFHCMAIRFFPNAYWHFLVSASWLEHLFSFHADTYSDTHTRYSHSDTHTLINTL